jgi:hypothetical protein
MRLLLLRVIAIVSISIGFFTYSFANSAGMPSELGTSWPSTAINVSKDSDYFVYRWEVGSGKNSTPIVQINAKDGRVLTAFILSSHGMEQLPFGERVGKVWYGPTSNGADAVPKSVINTAVTSGAGQCPCTAHTVYDDGITKVIVVTDSQGNIIAVYKVNTSAK